ncbi:uncharacterized protein LOC120834331 isoform X1 [Gasterosteus aculeatus]
MDANDHGEGLMQPAVALGRMLGEIAAMQREQAEANRHFLGALQAATDRQTQVLEQLAARPVASPTTPGPSAYAGVVVHKMTPEDDVQSYLEMFEAMAGACGWPVDEWAIRLLPLLTGEAQTAALGLPPGPRHVYASVKKAIMDRLGLSPEDHRRRFREARLGLGDRPFPFAQRLTDAANRWLQPEGAGGAPAVVEKVVMEQFLEGLPPRTAAWVRYHRPATLEAAVTLAEDHLAVHPGGRGEGGRPTASTQPVPAPRRSSPRPVATRPPPSPRALAPQRGTDPPGLAGTLPDLQRAPQPPGQECWRCGQPGHYRRECPLMEVGQTVRVAGPPAPSPGLGATYSVPTDASNRGLGAVLSQQVQGVDRPVLYISRKLSEREARYSTVEKECLAIRWAVDSLRYYLLGRQFTLCSDHAPLQWLHRMKDANARITRWYLALQPFNFKVIHRPGAQMVVADFLSRPQEGGGGESVRPDGSPA